MRHAVLSGEPPSVLIGRTDAGSNFSESVRGPGKLDAGTNRAAEVRGSEFFDPPLWRSKNSPSQPEGGLSGSVGARRALARCS